MIKRIIVVCLCALMWCGNPAFAQFAGGEMPSSQTKKQKNTTQRVFAKGYKGFAELGMDAGTGISAGIYTSHGYQFNPYLYTGAGIGFNGIFLDGEGLYLPIFAECRVNILNPNRFRNTPFAGVRVGGSVLEDTQGFYFHLFLGYRFPFRKAGRSAFTLNLGYQLGNTYYDDYNDYYTDDFFHMFSLRFGFEF